MEIDEARMTPQLWDNTQELPGLKDPVPVDTKAAQKKAEKAAEAAYKKAMKKAGVGGTDNEKDKKVCVIM